MPFSNKKPPVLVIGPGRLSTVDLLYTQRAFKIEEKNKALDIALKYVD